MAPYNKSDQYYHYFRWIVCNNLRLQAADGLWPEIKDPSLICYHNIGNSHNHIGKHYGNEWCVHGVTGDNHKMG
jgi:hypothetical protein